MPDLISKLAEERTQVADELNNMASAEDFNPDAAEFADLQERGNSLDKRITALKSAAEQRAKADDLWSDLRRAPAAQGGVSTADIGDQVLRSGAWKAYLRDGAGGRAHLMEVQLERRALITSSWFPGQDSRIVATPPVAGTPLLNVLSNVQVSSSSVEVVTYQAAAPLAGVVAEGAAKPEATIATAVTPVTLDTLAHWIKVTRRALADEAMVRDLITGGLMRGVNDKAEAEAATVIQGGTYSTVAGDDMLQSIRMGLSQVQAAGFRPNAVLINPADSALLDFSIWGLSGSVSQNGSVFGLQVVPANAITAGTAFVGDFVNGAKFLYQGAAQLYVTDSDVSDGATVTSDFRHNRITFLAEMTAKTVIVQAAAIVECTPTPGVVGAQSSGQPGLAARLGQAIHGSEEPKEPKGGKR